MEMRDRIASAALGVSIFALVVAGLSALYTKGQYDLAARRDSREVAAQMPIFDPTVKSLGGGRLWSIALEVTNRSDSRLVFDTLQIEHPEGSVLATAGTPGLLPGKGLVATNNLPNYLDDIPAFQKSTWQGLIFINPDMAVGTGKPTKIVVHYHRFDDPKQPLNHSLEFTLP